MSNQSSPAQAAPMASLAVAPSRAFPSEFEWRMIMQTAAHVWKSGMASDYGVKSESTVILIMLKGWEMGLPLMGSLEHVRVIHGRVSLSAECQQALVLSRVHGARFKWTADGRDGVAELVAVRPGHADVSARYTMEDAQRGGVAGKNPTYRTWPANLLRAGAMRTVCRLQFPDVILGMVGMDDEEPEEVSQVPAPALAAPPAARLPASPSSVEKPIVEKRAALPAMEGETLPVERPSEQPAPEPEVAPGVQQSSREPGEDVEDGPPDYPLPFEDGRYAGKRLSDLVDEREFRMMLNGFRNAAATAEKEGNRERMTDRLGWADLVQNWANFRGIGLK